MNRITRLLLALIMFALFSISYLASVSAQTKEGIDRSLEMYEAGPKDPFDHDAGLMGMRCESECTKGPSSCRECLIEDEQHRQTGHLLQDIRSGTGSHRADGGGRAIDWNDSNTWPPHICFSGTSARFAIDCKYTRYATRDEQLKSEAAAAEERIHPTTCSNRVGALITPTQLNRAFKPGNRSVVDGGSNADHTAEVRNNLHSICADAIEPGLVDWDGHCATRVTNILKPSYEISEIGKDTTQPPAVINSEWLKEAIALCNDWVEAGGKFPGLRRDDN
jgi:hypothetical protein